MYKAKNYKSAIENYKKALTLDPNYFQAIYNLGLALYRLDKHDESISYLRKIISGDYANFEKRDAYNTLGDNLFLQENYQLSIEAYTNAIKLDRSSSKAYLGRGIVYKKLKNYDYAEGDFLEALNQGMRNGLLYSLLGDINFNTKNYQQGIYYYELAIKYYEKDEYLAGSHFWKGYSLLKINRIDEACDDFKIAYKLDGKSYEKYYTKYCNP